MTTDQLIRRFASQDGFCKLMAALQNTDNMPIGLRNLAGSSRAVLSAAAIRQKPCLHLFTLPDYEAAAYFYNDLYQLLGGAGTLFFPASIQKSKIVQTQANSEAENPSNEVQRTAVLAAVSRFCNSGGSETTHLAVVSYPEALAEPVASPQTLQNNTLVIHKGEKLNIEFICETLIEYGFERTDFVYVPGQFSVRGSIVDIFSYASNKPCRLDFFGNEIETIRIFDVNTQLSMHSCEETTIISHSKNEGEQCLLQDYLPNGTLFWGVHSNKVIVNNHLPTIAQI